ncbi:MAG: hypothetical protein FAZ92_00864 [Accumulibacter sp.]|uniref:hypothetical protein n=1 Tax=Accumulibacter sp. TaxID=2053492 RepID=UPI00120C8C79|nr:hypothetical protein [Accumulibacter sp.]QKS31242.1 MAG: hypothetical protein HT579_21320 [Candidatus Accumulibacter similis]TLD46852.1 MAG: hypothetical protein FAZ92_00864 [Accumulibacter sp.]
MNAALAEIRTGMRIADLQSGFELLSRLPLANSERAEGEINHFLDSLLQSPPVADVYLQLLEQTRISLCFIEEELARRYTNKALPLGRNEEEAFRQVVGTWLKAARAYAHCAQLQGPADSAAHAERLALILHRCIYYTGMAITEHFRARQQLPAGLWLNLLGYYASAEEWGIATLPVADSLDCHGRSTHCMAATVALLLLDLAGPYSLSTVDLGLVRRWASNWAPLVSMQPPVDGEPLPALVVDLMHDAGLHGSAEGQRTEHLRRLDSTRLAMQISAARTQLQQRIAPAQLGLGEDCSSAQCQRLLNRLYRPWCLMRSGRRFRRHDAAGTATVCTGFAGMHFHISGSEFSQPECGQAYTRQDFDNLFAFRHMLDPTQMLEIRQSQLGLHLETWRVLDQCANGFRIVRSLAGGRIETGQLLALCPHDGHSYLLAQVAWLMQESDGNLTAGVAALPGKPRAVAARMLGIDADSSALFSRAFLLPALPVMGSEPTLIIPRGWYRPQRVLEVYDQGMTRVRLQHVAGDGPDFERVSFVTF